MRAVFLDRDGVLNKDGPGFVTSPAELEILPGIPQALRELQQAGLQAVVVTNQSAVARGLMTESDLEQVHAKLRNQLGQAGAYLDAIYYCPHAPWDDCTCRKPKPGMLLKARDDLGIDLSRSYMVGDKPTDIECGSAAGCRTVLVLSGLSPTYEPEMFPAEPDHVCADLAEAVRWILNEVAADSRDHDGTAGPS